MVESRKRRNEPTNSLAHRFFKRVRRSGVLFEMRRRRFSTRRVNRRARRESALYRERRRETIEKARKLGSF